MKLKRQAKISNSISGIIFDSANTIFMIIICITMIYPILYVISLSLGGGGEIFSERLNNNFSRGGYEMVFNSKYIMAGFGNTIARALLGTSMTIVASMFAAYPLSKKHFPHRSFWTFFIVFTMFFSGGLIPNYLLVKSLGFMDKIWALVLPGLIPTFNMLIMRNYFSSIPESIEESARIDGANDIIILFRIIVPVSLPIIATVVLWTVVGHWNAWFDGLLYINTQRKQVLQTILRGIVVVGTFEDVEKVIQTGRPVAPEELKAATIVVAMAPIIAFYPFVQKYFVKGIMIGSLKG